MKRLTAAVACCVAVTLSLTTGVTVAGAASATTQVTGTKLASALLPGSDFGTGFDSESASNTGRELRRAGSHRTVAETSCDSFAGYEAGLGGYGDTAEANTAAYDSATSAGEFQDVGQFASHAAAGVVFGQLRQKFRECSLLPIASLEGSFVIALAGRGVTSGTAGGHQAFRVDQAIVFIGTPTKVPDLYLNTTIALVGDDVFEVQTDGYQNVPVPDRLPDQLIGRVQALYR